MTKWGNPNTKTFARQNLRGAVYGDIRVQVHKLVWPMVERILIGLDQAGIAVDGVTELDDTLKQGFNLPGADVDTVTELIKPAQFVYDGRIVRFVGTADDAAAMVALMQNEQAAEDDIEDEPLPIATDELVPGPFSREIDPLAPDTVLFIQYLTSAEPTGEFDAATSARLSEWQARWGGKPTGELDDSTWALIVPTRMGWLRPGATGMQIKVIQAAFKARGYYRGVINGVWGVELSRSLRHFQVDYRIHPRLRIGRPEWEALFNA